MYNNLIVDIVKGKVSEEQLPEKLSDIDLKTKITVLDDNNVIINEVSIPIEVAENSETIKAIRDGFQLVDENKKTFEEYSKEMKEKYGLNEEQISQIINENFEKEYASVKNKSKKDKTKTKKDKTKKELLDPKKPKEPYINKLSRKKKLKKEQEQVEKDLEELENPSFKRNLEEKVEEANDNFNDAETKLEKDKAKKELLKARKDLRDYKAKEKKAKTEDKANKISERGRLQERKREIISEREILESEIKEMESQESQKESESVDESNELLEAQKEALKFLEDKKAKLEKELDPVDINSQDLIKQGKTRKEISKARKQEKERVKKVEESIRNIKNKIEKTKRSIELEEIKTPDQIKKESQYSKQSIEELESSLKDLQDRYKAFNITSNIFEVSDVNNKIKSLKKEINSRKLSEAKEKGKKEIDKTPKIKDQVGSKVSWNGQDWILQKDGVRYELVSENGKKFVDLPNAKDKSTFAELGLKLIPVKKTKAKKKRNLTNLSNEGVTVDGVDYVFILDEKGNIIKLSPVDSRFKSITNEGVLVQAEIERNRFDINSLTEEEITEESVDAEIKENPELQRVELIGAEGFTDTVNRAWDKIIKKSKALTNTEFYALDEYLDNALDAALKAYLESPTQEMNEFYEQLYTLRTQLYEEAEARVSEEIDNEREQKSEASKEEQQEEARPRTIEELEKQAEEEISEDSPVAKDKEILKTQKERKKLGIEDPSITDDIFSDISESVVEVVENIENEKEVDQLKAQYASDYLYEKYKQLSEMLKNPNRKYTVDQINSVRNKLDEDLNVLAEITETAQGSKLLGGAKITKLPAKKEKGSERKRRQREERREKRKERNNKIRIAKENNNDTEVNKLIAEEEAELNRLIAEEEASKEPKKVSEAEIKVPSKRNNKTEVDNQTSLLDAFDNAQEESNAENKIKELESKNKNLEKNIEDESNKVDYIRESKDNDQSVEELVAKNYVKVNKDLTENDTGKTVGRGKDIKPSKVSSDPNAPSIRALADSIASDTVKGNEGSIDADEVYNTILDLLNFDGSLSDWKKSISKNQELKNAKDSLISLEKTYNENKKQIKSLLKKFPNLKTNEDQDVVKKDELLNNVLKEEEIIYKSKDEEEASFFDSLGKEDKTNKKGDDKTNDLPFQKRKFTEENKTNETISENPDLFNYIKGVLKKAFPNVTVNMINSMLEKYGVDALASAYKNAVDIQKDSAVQTSIIHEFAHIYVDMLGKDHPLVKAGLSLMEGTDLHKRAIQEYPESEGYSKEDQLMEALVESIAIKNLSTLRTNFEGTSFDKFTAYAKRLWNRIKGLFNSKYYNEIDTIAKEMINTRVKNKNGVSSRVQFQKNISPKLSELINTVQNSISQLRMYAVRNPEIDYESKNVQGVETYSNLLIKYKQEKDPNTVTLNPIFENINLEEPSLQNLYLAIKENNPEFHEFIQNSINSVTKKSNLEKEEGLPEENSNSSNPIKANKGFSPSVKSLLGALVDNEGNPIDTNEVFRFVAAIANTSLNGEDFFRRIKDRKEKNNNSIISDRVYNMLKSMPSKDRQLLVFEMSNAVQTPYAKFAFLQNYKNNNDSVGNKLLIRQLNKDYETGIVADVYLKKIKTFSDQDALQLKQELFGNLYPNSTLGEMIKARGYFGERFAKYKSVTNDNRKKYNELISTLLGEEVPLSYTDKIIDNNKTTDRYTEAQNLIGRIYSQTNTDNESKPFSETGIDSILNKIAKEVEGSQGLVNSFLNSRGERVSTTGLGHSMTDVIKRYRDDIASPQRLQQAKKNYRDLVESNASTQEISDASNLVNDITKAIDIKEQYDKSPIYKNNSVLKRARKNNGIINNFIADAIDNNGNVRELSEQTKDDVMITQAMGFANTKSSNYYMQQYGIQGDRPNTRFFEVPRHSKNELKQAYNELKEIDNYLYKEFKEFSKNEKGENTEAYINSLKNYRKTYNNSTLNHMNEDGSIETPYENNDKAVKVRRKALSLKRALKKAKLAKEVIVEDDGEITETPSVIGSDLVGEGKLYKNEKELLENFVLNESLNRTHLNNLFQGPVVHRKSIEDHIKRALGTNSTGNLINVDKPVVTVVIKANSKVLKDEKGLPIPISDSMSINGQRLHSHIAKQIGGEDRLGANMKDLLFQIDPTTGRMTFLKMSSIGIIGDEANNNFMEMGSSSEGRVSYEELAKVSFALEKAIGDGKYLKIIDEKAIKGNEGKNVTPIDIDSLLGISEDKNKLQDVINNNSFELDYTGYRTPFKMNKDLSKVPLDKQLVVGSGQMMKIALNTGHPEDVQELEGKIVKLLKRQLGIDKNKGYTDSKIYNNLLDKGTLLNGVLKSTEESGKESISNILQAISENNSKLDKEASPYLRKYTAALKNNPDINKRSNEVVAEIKENKKISDKILSGKITALDHPNIKAQIEQYIGSKMGRTGARPELAGNYLHMIPDYGKTLKSPKLIKSPINNKIKHNKKIKKNQTKLERLKEIESSPDVIQKQEAYLAKLKEEKRLGVKEVLTDFEVAVPWSTFGSTREEAEAFIKSRKDEGRPVKVVVVRVPASIGVSTFGADVAYLTDGKANTVITPDEFIKMSDADHDGDKAFVYREDLKTDKNEETGESKTAEIKGIKSELFWNLYTQLTSDEIREQHNEDLSTDNIENIVNEINEKKGVEKQSYSLETFEELADLLSKYSFGSKAIGIEAVAGKILSMFTQSNIELKYGVDFDGKTYKNFVRDNDMDVAKILQAALDLGNNPIILQTGINKHTIGVANVMLYLGVPLNTVIKTLRSPAIEGLVNEIDRNSSVFSGFENPIEMSLENKKSELSGVIELPISQKVFNNNINKFLRLQSIIKKNSSKDENDFSLLKVNEFYQTKPLKNEDGTQESPIQFTVKLDEKNNKVIKVESALIKDESKRSQYELMKSFIEFNAISNEINSILPVVQRDNSMPNNSSELRKTKNAFDKLRTGSLVDFTPLIERPLVSHYEEVVDLMINLEEEHFATEKGSYDQSQNNVIDSINNSIQKYGSKVDKRNKVIDVFQKMIAQGNIQVSKPNDFVKELPEKIEAILAYQKSGKYESSNPSIDNILQYAEGSQEYNEAVDQYKNMANTKEEEAIVLDKIKKAKEEQRYIEQNSILKDNKFIQSIQVSESKTGAFVKTIVPVDNYRKISQLEKEAIREDFNKIKDTSIGQDILKYQMLRNGVSDKIGSLIDLMPNDYSIMFLKKMSAIKESGKNQPNFKQAYTLNALLALESEIPKAVIMNNYYVNNGWLKDSNGSIIKVPSKIGNSSVSKNTIVPRIKSTQFVNNSDYKFIKFDPNATTVESSTETLKDC